MAEATGRYGALRFLSAEGRERVRLLEQPSIRLGRGEANDLMLEDASVALRHARLTIEGGRLIVEDLGSGTGTFVGGRLIPPGTPTMVEADQEVRFGEVATRFDAPATAEAAAAAGSRGLSGDAAPELAPAMRVALNPPTQPLTPGGGPVMAQLQVTNTGRIVDQLTISVVDLPEEWVRLSSSQVVLAPNESTEISIAIQVPKRPDARAGQYEFSVMVASGETGREAFAAGTLDVSPSYGTIATLRPRRSTRRFELNVENRGNSPLTYVVAGRDQDERLQFSFEAPSITVEPGETQKLAFQALSKRRWFGRTESYPFDISLAATVDPTIKSDVSGVVGSVPPLQRFLVPGLIGCAVLAAVLGALIFLLWPSGDDDVTAQDFLSDVHPMCDPDADPEDQAEQTVRTGTSGAVDGGPVLFAQNDADWAPNEYAKAKDPDFGPDWCGDSIAQCGCAMTSMANVMSVLQLATMPGGQQLTPQTLNDWMNLQALRDSRGWVSQGYAYGNVIWLSANQLSGEMAREFGTPTVRFNGWGPGDDAFIRSELEQGRPVVLEIPGHFIAAYGIEEATNRILIYDPFYPDRTTIDWYHDRGIPIKGSRLFEPSDDLSGVMITTPRDVRIKVTRKDTGEEVGTLSELPADEAADRARLEVEGAEYLTSPAWRDPTCTEKAPPPEAGVNQIWLPGSIDDYIVEYLDTGDDVPAIAIHSYDEDGNLELLHDEAAATGMVHAFDADPEPTPPPTPTPTEPGDDDSPTPATPATPDDADPPAGGGTTGGGTTSPPAGEPNGGTTQPPPDGPAGPGTPPGDPDGGVTAASGPDPVTVTCMTTFQSNPKLATVNCIGQVGGSFNSLQWAVNGVPAASTDMVFSTSFTSNTAITVTFTACNVSLCGNASQAVLVNFPPAQPPGNGGTVNPPVPPTNGGGGAVAPAGAPSCSVSYVVDSHAMVACLVSVQGTHTAIHWSAPGTTNPAQTSLQQTYMTNVPNNGRLAIPLRVENRVCNGLQCTTINIDLDIRPRYSTETEWWSPFFSTFDRAWKFYRFDSDGGLTLDTCVNAGETYLLEVEAFVADSGLPPQVQNAVITGFVQFFADGSPLGAPVPVTIDTSEGISYSWLTTFGAPGGAMDVSAQFLGTINLLGSSSPSIRLPGCIDPPKPIAPENGDVIFDSDSEFSSDTVLLDWSPVEEAFAYELEVREVGFSGPQLIVTQSLTPSQFLFAIPELGTYEWRVRAFGSGDRQSEWSETFTFVFKEPEPLMVIDAFTASVSDDCPDPGICVEIHWEVSGDPFGTLEITRSAGAVLVHAPTSFTGTFYETGLPELFCFTYTLTATNSDGIPSVASAIAGNFCGPG